MTPAAQSAPPSPVHVSKLGDVEFQTQDVDRLVNYYTAILDFVEVDRSAHQVFLTPSFDHHAVVVTKGATKPRTTVGWEIFEDLADAEKRLMDAGFAVERRSDIAPSTTDVLILDEPLTGTKIQP